MIALAATFIIGNYLLGPELLCRWLFAFVVPRKNVVQTRGEEVTRALVWAILPLAIAISWSYLWWHLHGFGSRAELKTVFAGIYSESFFSTHQSAFFAALTTVGWMNVALLWRLYLIVTLFSLTLNYSVKNYCRLRQTRRGRFILRMFAQVTLPRIAEWHLLLSGMLLPKETFELHADVLTKAGTLYQGRIQDKHLAPDGTLLTLTMTEPRRFLREQFQEQKSKWPKTVTDSYWRGIPGNLFVISASEISSINLRYVEPKLNIPDLNEKERAVLQHLMQRLQEPARGTRS